MPDVPVVPTRARILVLALLVLVTLVGYADRQVIALLKPVLDRELGWTASDYATISSGFQLAVAIGFLGAGWLVDRFGPRMALGVGLVGWSLCAVLHAAARSVTQFLVLRTGLGLFESVGTPAMMAAVSTTFRAAERGRVIGFLNAAPNLAAMLTPLLVGLLFPLVGWTGTVAIIGGSGFLCALAWMLVPLRRPTPDRANTGPTAAARPVDRHMLARMTAAFALSKLLTDPVWWFMLFWLPDLLHRRFGLDVAHLGLPLAAAYACAAAGSLLGGFLPHRLARGGDPEPARRRVMAVAAACVLPVPLVLVCSSLATGVALVGLALAAHQAFAANLFGFASERVPAAHVGRVTSIGAFCGNLGGAIILRTAGGSALLPVFGYCALAYLLAWCVFSLLAPLRRLRRADGPDA